MDIHKLKYFFETAKHQHVTRAAESINIAQPALTHAIKDLERELDVPLFVRKGRNIVLTEYGSYLQSRLASILPELDSIPAELAQMKSRRSNTVRLNILAASSFVIDIIVRYRQEHPDVIFDFEQNVYRQDCDVVVTTNGMGGVSSHTAEKRWVRKEKIYLAVPISSEYSELSSIALADVRDENFIMLSSSRMFGVVCKELCASVGFSPRILFESDSPAAVQNIVGTGAGIAFWPEFSWGNVGNDQVSMLPITEPECSRELVVELFRHSSVSDYSEDFYNFLISNMDI